MAALGWRDDPELQLAHLRLAAIERHEVGDHFPRLVRSGVPAGVEDADYIVTLPALAGPVDSGGNA